MPPEMTIAGTSSIESDEVHANAGPGLLRRARVLAAALFVAALFIPMIGTIMHWDPVESHENRVLARIPSRPTNFKQVKAFSDLFLAYYRDHFGFRNSLIRGLTLVNFHGGLAVDQNTNIIIGKGGWLFFPSDPNDMLADRYLEPFSPEELDQWQAMLERRNKYCLDHGIKFVAVIPPDKQTVYPEFLPPEFSRLGKQSRLDQLIERLQQTHSPVHLVDLRPVLAAAKKNPTFPRLYFKTDTHWNDYGAYAAYPAILEAVNQELGTHMVLQPMSAFSPQTSIQSGDLARYMNLYYEYNEDWLQLTHQPPFPVIADPASPYTPVTTTGRDAHAPRLWMIHDSFTLRLAQFLGPHFSQVCWQWTIMYNGPVVTAFKPNIVIDEFLERTLYLPAPVDTVDVLAEKPR